MVFTHCINRYRVRAIQNGPMVLILVWNCLIWAIVEAPSGEKQDSISYTVPPSITTRNPKDYLIPVFTSILWFSSAFISAWLVGWKTKYIDLILAGLLVTSIGVLLENLIYVIAAATTPNTDTGIQSTWVIVAHIFSQAVISIGSAPVVTNLFQLALEQNPGASAQQLSSLASWFLFSTTLGLWLSKLTGVTYVDCAASSIETTSQYLPCLKIASAIFMTVLLSSYLILKHHLLDNFPVSYASRQIYLVLKYALTHNAPQKRSALTYWEEAPPSRLNLGKTKYGGPFTNEQVEDVRTFCQMSMLCVFTFLFLITISLNESTLINLVLDDATHPGWSPHKLNLTQETRTCKHSLLLYFVTSTASWQLIFILLYELVLAPAFSYRLPSMLQRMGFAGGIAMVTGAFLTFLSVADRHGKEPLPANYISILTPTAALMGFSHALFYTAGLEFICAQSPYNMKNFFVCSGWFIVKSSSLSAVLTLSLWNSTCSSKYCPIIYSIATLLLAAGGLVMFCLAARWYRKRSRGHEDEHQQKWVEDAFDKYIEDNLSNTETYWLTEK